MDETRQATPTLLNLEGQLNYSTLYIVLNPSPLQYVGPWTTHRGFNKLALPSKICMHAACMQACLHACTHACTQICMHHCMHETCIACMHYQFACMHKELHACTINLHACKMNCMHALPICMHAK